MRFLVPTIIAISTFIGSGNFAPSISPTGVELGTWETVYNPTMTLNFTHPGGAVNYRNVVPTNVGGPWTKVRVLVASQSDASTGTITGSICVRSGTTDDCVSSPVQLLWSSVSYTYIPTNSTVLSDEATLSFSSADELLLHLWVAGAEGRYSWFGDDSSYEHIGIDETMQQSVAYSTNVHRWNFELVEGWNPD